MNSVLDQQRDNKDFIAELTLQSIMYKRLEARRKVMEAIFNPRPKKNGVILNKFV